jgi:hypothetical protein
MASKSSDYTVKVAGPGVTLDRPISEDVANQIINLVMTGSTGNRSSGGSAGGAGASGSELSASGSGGSGQGQLAGVSIKRFISQKRPVNMYQRVACLAYFLSHHQATPRFKTRDITQANTDAAQPKLTNASVAVMHATGTYHFLSAAGRGHKQISALGEAVVEALPNQENVKAILAENKPRGRKRASRKKKSR